MGAARPKQRVIVRMNVPAERRGGFPWAPFLVLCLVGALTVFGFHYETSYADAIYPGVKIAGVDVGGQTVAQAREELQPLARRAGNRTITVIAAGRSWAVTPKELGLKLNLDDRLREAYALGREDNLLDRYGTQAQM